MKRTAGAGDIGGMSAAPTSRSHFRGADLLIWQCSALARDDRLPAADRLQRLIGTELTRLLLVALTGDHRDGSRRLAA
jgi:hypothetical protein